MAKRIEVDIPAEHNSNTIKLVRTLVWIANILVIIKILWNGDGVFVLVVAIPVWVISFFLLRKFRH